MINAPRASSSVRLRQMKIFFSIVVQMNFGFAFADVQAPTINSPDSTATKSISLSLERAIAIAIQNATSVQRAKNDLDLTGAQLIQAYGQFLPSVGLTAATTDNLGTTYITTTTPAVVQGSSYGANLQVTSSLNLFNGKADTASLKSALARKAASSLSLERAKQQIALDVTQSFLQITLDHQITRVADKNLSNSRQREAQLEEQTRVGSKNKVDLFRQRAQTSADEYYFINSQNRERSDELLLLRKLKLEPDASYTFVEAPHEDASQEQKYFGDESQLIRTALSNRPDILASERLVGAAAWDISGAKALYLPRLDFNVSALSNSRIFQSQTVNGTNAVPASPSPIINQLGNQISYSFGLSLTWNIFDRDLTKANVARASIVANNARLELEDRRGQVINEIRQVYGDIQTAKRQIESTRKGLLSSEKAFELIQARYELGSANFIDLISAQGSLLQAQAIQAQSQINYDLQIHVLKSVLGREN